MGLMLGERKCINCHKYVFDLDDAAGSPVQTTGKRGDIQLRVECRVCDAGMALVYYDRKNHNHPGWAVAYWHTINDEPCYDEGCVMCAGNGSDAWWIEKEDVED